MTEREKIKAALTAAVIEAIEEVGLAGFKKTSLFMSNRKEIK